MTTPAGSLAEPYDPPTPTPLPRRSRLSRVPKGMWLAFVAAVVAAGMVLALLGGAKGTPVLVAAHPIAAGVAVSAGDFTVIDLDAPAATVSHLVGGSALTSIAGQVATTNIAEGDLVSRSSLSPAAAPNQLRAMSIPIDIGRAVNGSLRAGDLVDVIDSSSGSAIYVATGARVLGTGGGASTGLAASTHYSVTIAVDDRQALAVATAITSNKVDVVRATGAPAVVPSTSTVPTTTARRIG